MIQKKPMLALAFSVVGGVLLACRNGMCGGARALAWKTVVGGGRVLVVWVSKGWGWVACGGAHFVYESPPSDDGMGKRSSPTFAWGTRSMGCRKAGMMGGLLQGKARSTRASDARHREVDGTHY